MDELYELLHKSQTSLFCLFQKTWIYHWNVVGSDFYQLHTVFGEQYNTMFEEIDKLSEHMRYLRMKIVGPISRVAETSIIPEALSNSTAESMISQLLADNKKLIETLTEVSEKSDDQRLYATSNLVQGIIETHGKFVWMLRSFLRE
ncbi:DNA starvation/stationary phase protection protein [bacterium]|nr:DNA starvation/stationary phase protection protein [bacterium]